MIALADIPVNVYKALLILATIIWGFSFVVMKNVVEVVPPALLLECALLWQACFFGDIA